MGAKFEKNLRIKQKHEKIIFNYFKSSNTKNIHIKNVSLTQILAWHPKIWFYNQYY